MSVTLNLQPVIAVAAGNGIFLVPRLLNYIVTGYLIVSGLLDLGVFAT